MICQLSIKNFKSLRQVKDLPLKPLTIIIGPNAGGKSNLLDALETVRQIARNKGTIQTWKEDESPVFSFYDALWRKADETDEISWHISCKLTETKDNSESDEVLPCYPIEYGLTVHGNTITHEHLDAEWPPFENQMIRYLSRQGQNITVQRVNEGQSFKETTDISPNDLALHSFARTGFETIKTFSTYIKNWKFYKIVPDQARRLHQFRSDRQVRLGKDGQFLSNVIHYLREHKEADFNFIKEEMERNLCISDLQTYKETIARNFYKVFIEIIESPFADLKPFVLDNLSDGTVGLLTLLTALCMDESPGLICFEEPERSIHPHMLRRLAYYLHEAAQSAQLIITTHNAEFLDHFDPFQHEYVQVFVACRDKHHATQYVPIQNIQNVKEWLDDYMLGQVWTMGQIEEMLEVE